MTRACLSSRPLFPSPHFGLLGFTGIIFLQRSERPKKDFSVQLLWEV